ncbi:MAG: YqeG family HAD IIIA-type phosphatase [Streptococcaceae bacterium]|jgi:HAD superfamily phosphatase (TIGR01668 family)|nr:YqeG family HAD IIIA-type phosphatase [Streptococcaceae bacterium]
MKEFYRPTWLMETIFKLTPEMLKAQGIKAVLADLDNTLIAWNNPDVTDEVRLWLKKMQDSDILVMVVSNNKTSRVKRAVEPLGIDFVSWSLKPLNRGMEVAKRKLGLRKEELVMVGDQLMTDVLAANFAGIRSILVKPLVQSDSLVTKFNRMCERFILKKLSLKYDMSYRKGIY